MKEHKLFSLTPLAIAALVLGTAPRIAHAELDCTDTVPIYQIQGKGHISPYLDQEVSTCGVVTAVGFNFYFLQDPMGDGDPATSDGMYIFSTALKPSVGDYIHISGEVEERIPGGASTGNLSTTQMSFPTIVETTEAATLPAPVVLGEGGRLPPSEIVISEDEFPVNLQEQTEDQANNFNPENDAIDFYESLEGMLVTVQDAVAVSAIRQFGSFSAEAFTLADQGVNATPTDSSTAGGGILLQPDLDNKGDQNPERIQIQFDGTVYPGNDYPDIQVGDLLGDVTGVVGYSFGNFEVFANEEVTPVKSGLMPEVAYESSADQLTIASYNVLNLSAVEGDDDQREKIAMQIVDNMHSPDIIALQEIQDNNGDVADCGDDTSDCSGILDASETLQALADAITLAGGPRYSWLNVDPLVETTDDNRDDPDAFGGAEFSNIRNAFLYNDERVDLVEFIGLTRSELANRGVDESTAFDASRDPLEARFEFNDHRIIILNNHFSSRFGSSPIFGGPQPFVQAAEETREAQSLAMHQLVKQYLSLNPNDNIIVLGDLNTFEFTNDLTEILPAAEGETLLYRIGENQSKNEDYSFIFDGNSQALDHAFVTANLKSITELDYVHVNVDYPRRTIDVVASDHEPLLAVVSLATNMELGLRGDVYSSTALEIFWNRLSGAARYEVEQFDGVLETDATSVFLDQLNPNPRYTFTVRAYNTNNEIIASDSLTLNTADNGIDSLLNELEGTVYSSSAIELFWSINTMSDPGRLSFNVYRDGQWIALSDGRSFFEDDLLAGTLYEYTVEALVDGLAVDSKSISLTTNGQAGSGGSLSLTGDVYSSSAVEVFWLALSDATLYQIERDGIVQATRDARSFFDFGLAQNTTYNYRVSAIDTNGDVIASQSVELTTQP